MSDEREVEDDFLATLPYGICEFTHPSCQPGFRHVKTPNCIGWHPAAEDDPIAVERARTEVVWLLDANSRDGA